MSDTLAERYYLDLAAAFVRGKLPGEFPASPGEVFRRGEAAGLRLHKFKRSETLPRVRRVLGLLRSFYPEDLLDIGSGRGVFLWSLLDGFPELRVTCVDLRKDRVEDIDAVARGGVPRLSARQGDATQLPFAAGSFAGVTALEVLEHIPEAEKAVQELVRVAQRFVVCSVPSKPDDNPEHIHLFDGTRLHQMFTRAGAKRVSIDYVLQHIILVALL